MDALTLLVAIPALLVSLSCHEAAHGFVADALGDRTARDHGRLTLNPIKHLDVVGSLVLVALLVGSGGRFAFGWAKPVPVDPQAFTSPRRGMMLVGAAGPGANIALALLAGVLLRLLLPLSEELAQAMFVVFLLNVILAAINLLPIPPLDGSRVVAGLLPESMARHWQALDRYESFIFMGFVVIWFVRPEVLSWYLTPILDAAAWLLLLGR